MSQPQWKELANLGDASPIEYGGYFVYEDTTGTYEPKAEVLKSSETDEGTWYVYRLPLDRCTWIDGVLSDNPYHPGHAVWFAGSGDLSNVADFAGIPEDVLRDLFCSENPIDRAEGYRMIGEYFGFENLDGYPLTLTRAEVDARYPEYV